jgi:hypothetical protein
MKRRKVRGREEQRKEKITGKTCHCFGNRKGECVKRDKKRLVNK